MFTKAIFQYNTPTMLTKKKLLIVSISSGAGHTRAAEALENAAYTYPNLDVKHINFFDYISPFAKRLVFDWFPWTMNHAPKLYGLSFLISDNASILWLGRILNKLLYKKHGKKLVELLLSHNPDYVLCTAPIIPYSIDLIREKNNLSFKTGIVVTDYYAHTLWRHTTKDTSYFVATEEVGAQLQKHNIAERYIYASGIPVDDIWYEQKNTPDLKEKLHLTASHPIALILSGGHGFLDTVHVVQELIQSDTPLTIIASCGKNAAQLNKLRQLSTPPHIALTPLGWTDNLDEYIRVADTVIARAGGLSTTECLALRKHAILLDPIPGEGRKNAAYIERMNYGTVAKHPKQLLRIIKSGTMQTLEPIPHIPKATKIILDHIQKELS